MALWKEKIDGEIAFFSGSRQNHAHSLLQEAAVLLGVDLGEYVDNVVFSTGRTPYFKVLDDGRRIIALPASVLRRTRRNQLIAATHELLHARVNRWLGWKNYLGKIIFGSPIQHYLHEALLQRLAIQKVERQFGALNPAESCFSWAYVQWYLHLAELAADYAS
jgi:hypothetical protein